MQYTTTNNRYLYILLFSCFILACNTSKKVIDESNVKALSSNDLNKIIFKHQNDFTYFAGKAKVDASQNGTGMGVTAQIRMKKNEYLWMAVSKFSFEIARAYITPDSAFIIDRFHKEYYAEDLRSYLDEYQIPFEFSELQGMFIGNAPLPHGKNPSSELVDLSYNVIYRKPNRSSYIYQIDGVTQHIRNSIFTDIDGRSVASAFSKYDENNLNTQSPYQISHEVRDDTNVVELDIQYTDMIFNVEKSAPFEIPSHYVKVQ